MKFKSPSDQEVYVALTSGHACRIGPEFREIPPILHRRALELGCITDNMDEATIQARIQSAAPVTDRKTILVKTITDMMDNPQPGDITASHLPNLKVLSKKAGWAVSREEMMQAMHEIASQDDDELGEITTSIGGNGKTVPQQAA